MTLPFNPGEEPTDEVPEIENEYGVTVETGGLSVDADDEGGTVTYNTGRVTFSASDPDSDDGNEGDEGDEGDES